MADRPATTPRKKPGRKRRVAGWVLLVIGVLITGVWGASRWRTFSYQSSEWNAVVVGGRLTLNSYDFSASTKLGGMVRPAQGWVFEVLPAPIESWTWLVHADKSPSGNQAGSNREFWGLAARVRLDTSALGGPVVHGLLVVLWPVAIASLLGGGWLVWSGRRARSRAMTGLCRKCGYDLRGLAAGAPCPECGVGAKMVH